MRWGSRDIPTKFLPSLQSPTASCQRCKLTRYYTPLKVSDRHPRIPITMEPSNERTIATTAPTKAQSRPKKPKNNNNNSGSSSGRQTQGQQSAKLRGLPKDSVEVRISKTLSWLLRHGAQSQGLTVRPDGFIKVSDVVRSICMLR